MNECVQFQIDCGSDRTCFNTQGAYECVDVPCPIGYERENGTDCILKCIQHSMTCSHRRASHVRYRFLALSRSTPLNQTLFHFPTLVENSLTTAILIDRNHMKDMLPFYLDGSILKNNQILINSNDFEFEIHLYLTDIQRKSFSSHLRRRLHTLFMIRINVSPFHF